MDVGRRRVFTLEEANGLLPSVREQTRRAIESVAALPSAHGDATEERATRAEAARVLAGWVTAMVELGVEVKGPWLVDFDSGAGYYCWTWPEESIQFFHGYDEGFTRRVRLQ
ncbi:DUF2203 family protein [Acidobacteria bacterium ACD]|nr:MAG: DUF2203 family protein [Acidobacteriota bacterium]MCE7958089.1 DUF2203 family protein [Acidobacteria bacterium ACB2]MDL1950978.1 DUF2203 family protein [Acidobacteria bacterium ACD]